MEAKTNLAKRFQPLSLLSTAFFNGAAALSIYFELVSGWKSHPDDVKMVHSASTGPASQPC